MVSSYGKRAGGRNDDSRTGVSRAAGNFRGKQLNKNARPVQQREQRDNSGTVLASTSEITGITFGVDLSGESDIIVRQLKVNLSFDSGDAENDGRKLYASFSCSNRDGSWLPPRQFDWLRFVSPKLVELLTKKQAGLQDKILLLTVLSMNFAKSLKLLLGCNNVPFSVSNEEQLNQLHLFIEHSDRLLDAWNEPQNRVFSVGLLNRIYMPFVVASDDGLERYRLHDVVKVAQELVSGNETVDEKQVDAKAKQMLEYYKQDGISVDSVQDIVDNVIMSIQSDAELLETALVCLKAASYMGIEMFDNWLKGMKHRRMVVSEREWNGIRIRNAYGVLKQGSNNQGQKKTWKGGVK